MARRGVVAFYPFLIRFPYPLARVSRIAPRRRKHLDGNRRKIRKSRMRLKSIVNADQSFLICLPCRRARRGKGNSRGPRAPRFPRRFARCRAFSKNHPRGRQRDENSAAGCSSRTASCLSIYLSFSPVTRSLFPISRGPNRFVFDLISLSKN